MKLYAFTIQEFNGEYENRHDKLVKAINIEEATRKAIEYTKDWYGEPDSEESEGGDLGPVFYYNGGEIAANLYDIHETTKEEWLASQWKKALIN